MKSKYYIKIFNNHLKLITVFLIYDLEKNLIYFGDKRIGEISIPILNISQTDFKDMIPISKNLFSKFLNLSLDELNKTNKNLFLVFNHLEEWII